MAERVGFSKTIEAEWLHQAAELSIQGISREYASKTLTDIIGQRLSNASDVRTARAILLRTWFDNEPAILERAKAIYNIVSPAERIAIHWSLLLTQYPIFGDLCDVMGNLFSFRDEVTSKQIKEKIYEMRGESGTLIASLSKNLKTMRNLGTLSASTKLSVYAVQKSGIRDCQAIGILLSAVLYSRDQKYIAWSDFIIHPAIFPFTFDGIDESHMASLPYVLLDRFDGRAVLGIC